MFKLFTKVEHFNHEILRLRKPQLGELPADQRAHLINALLEEVGEFQLAAEEGDFIGSVDALIDLIYFAAGGLHKLGLSADDAEFSFMAVHTANMEKQKGVKESRAVGDAPDAIKPMDWVSPEERIRHYFFGE
jgi:predicted HAD superfamily Cof-like phosphohydrolase